MEKTKKLLTQKELAEVYGVTRSAVAHAIKDGHRIKGRDIASFVVRDSEGKFEGINPRVLFQPEPQTPRQTINVNVAEGVRSNPSANDPTISAHGSEKLSTALTTFPVALSAIGGTPEGVHKPLFAVVSALALGTLGYYASNGENKGFYTLLGAVTGASIFLVADKMQQATKVEEVGGEDRAMLRSNLSASPSQGQDRRGQKKPSPPPIIPLHSPRHAIASMR